MSVVPGNNNAISQIATHISNLHLDLGALSDLTAAILHGAEQARHRGVWNQSSYCSSLQQPLSPRQEKQMKPKPFMHDLAASDSPKHLKFGMQLVILQIPDIEVNAVILAQLLHFGLLIGITVSDKSHKGL
jgi:hypothetical protein